MNDMINTLAGIGTAFSQGVTGALDVRRKEEEVARRLRAEIQEMAGKRAKFLQEGIDARTKAGDGRGAASMLPAFTESANTAFDLKGDAALKAPAVVGSPIMKEQLGPPQTQGAMMPRVEVGRDFGNPQTLGAIRGGAMLAPVKPEYEYFSLAPGEERWRQAPGKPPERVASGPKKEAAPREPRYAIDPVTGQVKPVVPGTTFGVKQPTPHQPSMHIDPVTGIVKPMVPGATFNVPPTKPTPPSPEDKEIAKRREAAVIASRVLAKAFPFIGTPKVQAGSADIVISFPLAVSQSGLDGDHPDMRRLQNAVIDLGGYVVAEPGQKPRIVLNPGSTASQLQAKLKDPSLVWARNTDNTQTLVEKRAGVTSAAPPTKPKAPRVWGTADEARVDAEFGRQWKARYPYGYRGDPKHQAEEEQTMRETIRARYEAAPEFGGSAGTEGKPDAAAELVEMMRADKAARKGGKK